MSLVDKIISAVTPTEDSEKNVEARRRAEAAANDSGWLSMVLDHHKQVEEAFANVLTAGSATARRAAQKRLALILTAHSIAEESVLYPAMANTDQKHHATEMYSEQSAVKIQMAALDDLDPMGEDYLDKLEHIHGAVAHHVAEEEGEYFIQLKEDADATLNSRLTRLYKQEFDRYMAGAERQEA